MLNYIPSSSVYSNPLLHMGFSNRMPIGLILKSDVKIKTFQQNLSNTFKGVILVYTYNLNLGYDNNDFHEFSMILGVAETITRSS